jgi:catechol 2,3-dioxygenase-like lactoylglutathione lyase family enzyme
MKRAIFCAAFFAALASYAFAQQASAKRPKITGIDHVDFYTTSQEANTYFYSVVLGLGSIEPVEPEQTLRFMIGTQWIGYSSAPDPNATDRLDHVAFATDSCAELRTYLAANKVKVPNSISELKDGSRSFLINDPGGHRIEFLEASKTRMKGGSITGRMPDPVSRHMIHVGFIVHDRDAEDHFYRDLLGFHIYWHGGMQPDRTDWVAMQVPDGTDWLEYMLNTKPNSDIHTTGVMNHLSLGVGDMKQAQAKLESHGWKPHGDEHAQMGKDGKWQLNLYDPDSTRIELMEFTPSQKPCCSDFQGPHPQEP